MMQRISHQMEHHLKLNEEDGKENEQQSHQEDYEDFNADDEEVEDFSFAFDALNFSTVSAEDIFDNGKIKPVFPLFNRDLLLSDGGGGDDVEDLESLRLKDRLPNVKNVFVEAEDDDDDDNDCNATTPSLAGDEGVVGPYCERPKKVVQAAPGPEPAPAGCKKSNSTGFSKIWRFKDFMHRSNSDGRDAFVFLNQPTPSTTNSTAAPSPSASGMREEKEGEGTVSFKKVNGNNGVGGEIKKVKKSKTAALSPHEVYMRNKAKDGDRRRSYLPYRPEIVGLFTNVTGGGLTRNVHPY